MVEQIFKKIRFKYAIWLASTIALTFIFYWHGFFAGADILRSFIELSTDKIIICMSITSGFWGNALLAYLAITDFNKINGLLTKAKESDDEMFKILEGFNFKKGDENSIKAFLKAVEDHSIELKSKNIPEKSLRASIEQLKKTGACELINSEEKLPELIKKGALASFGILLLHRSDSSESKKFNTFKEHYKKATQEADSLTTPLKSEKVLFVLYILIGLGSVVWTITNSAWGTLVTVVTGFIAGWLLSESERLPTPSRQGMYYWFAIILLSSNTFAKGYFNGKAQLSTGTSISVILDDNTIHEGRSLYISEKVCVLQKSVDTKKVYLPTARIRTYETPSNQTSTNPN